jgi:hypothetical protein
MLMWDQAQDGGQSGRGIRWHVIPFYGVINILPISTWCLFHRLAPLVLKQKVSEWPHSYTIHTSGWKTHTSGVFLLSLQWFQPSSFPSTESITPNHTAWCGLHIHVQIEHRFFVFLFNDLLFLKSLLLSG